MKMTDKKFTDEEIIKALECCYLPTGDCEKNCPMCNIKNCNDTLMAGYVRDLINRQRAEIKILKEDNRKLTNKAHEALMDAATIKTELIDKDIETRKEIERLQNILLRFMDEKEKIRMVEDIDNISTIPIMTEFNEQYRKDIKAEAYKEFAKQIKKEIENAYNNNSNVICEHMSKHAECPDYEFIAIVRGKMTALQGLDDFIDNLLKEMGGEE